jgi:hypothetical protein
MEHTQLVNHVAVLLFTQEQTRMFEEQVPMLIVSAVSGIGIHD